MPRMTPEVATKGFGVQKDGRLARCPDMPNCVCSMHATDTDHFMDPWHFSGTLDDARRRLKAVLDASERAVLVESKDEYMRAEFRSLIFRFVDDVEFLIAAREGLIHFRSASRLGYSDLGANRKRMTQLAKLFERTR